MTAGTKTQGLAELEMAQKILSAAQSGNLKLALAMSERAAQKYPTFPVPVGNGKSVTFGEIAKGLRGSVTVAGGGVSEPAPAAEPRKAAPRKAAPRKAAPRKAAPVKAAPVRVETVTLRLVHDGENPTSIYGLTRTDSLAHKVLGRKYGGQWTFWGGGDSWYLPKSGGYAPNDTVIGETVARLESLTGEHGEQLYRVESDIRTTGADGKRLPVRMTREQAAQWQRAYDGARNSLSWQLSMGTGTCGKCGATSLDLRTGRIGKGGDGMPSVECATCGGFGAPESKPEPVKVSKPAPKAEPEPVVDLSGMLALAAEPAPEPETVDCPMCGKPVAVVGGRLEIHNDRYGRGACRGKLGQSVTPDVEPEPEQLKARTSAPVKAEPESVDASDLVIRYALQAGMSNTARNDTATDVRKALSRKLTYGRTFRGVEIEVRRDKVNHQLTLTVVKGGEGFDSDELTAEIAKIVKGVRGVGNRVHK